MFSVDLNCDIGEGAGSDELIIPFISSASIACGYHAGDVRTMHETVELCLKNKVAIGAHPSFNDRINFGRNEHDISYAAVYGLVTDQLIALNDITNKNGATLHHVKPHGALYNMAAKDRVLASTIARAVRDIDKTLILYGLSGSCSITEAIKFGLKTFSEVFADRTYQDSGWLTARTQANALISDETKSVKQVLQMIKEKKVTTVSGHAIPIVAQTICIHGDGEHAVRFAKAIHHSLRENKIEIKA